MKKISLVFMIICSLVSFSAAGEMDPRIKALGTMAVYGTAGGALLGTASLAFDSGSRSIAKGASLGLYAGILFGSYIVLSHAMRQRRMRNPKRDEDYYPESDGVYEEEDSPGLFGRGKKRLEDFELYRSIAVSSVSDYNERKRSDFSFFLPVVHMNF